jgi:hypothetical protein
MAKGDSEIAVIDDLICFRLCHRTNALGRSISTAASGFSIIIANQNWKWRVRII